MDLSMTYRIYHLPQFEYRWACFINLTAELLILLNDIGYEPEDFEDPGDDCEYSHFFTIESQTLPEFEKIMKEAGFRENRRFF